MTKQEFWNLFKRFVQSHPVNEAMPCARLQTWAVLKNFEADLNDPALGMTIRDKGKAHYFSRSWAASRYNPNAIRHDYPMLLANILEVSVERVSRVDRIDRVVFDLAVLDTLRKPKGLGDVCGRRNEIEIFEDCHERLQECFAYMERVVVGTGTLPDTSTEPFIGSPEEAAYRVAAGVWTLFTPDQAESRKVQRRIKAMTERSKVFPWRGGTSGLYGVYAPELAMEFPVCEDDLVLDFSEAYEVAIHERETY